MQNKRLESACIARWLAALFVMTGHMHCLLQDAPPVILWNAIQRIGILVFFVLGGYLVTGSWANDTKYKNYYIKRIVRIFPPLIVFVFVVTFIIGPFLSSLSIKEYYFNPLIRKYLLNSIMIINYSLPGVFEYNPYPSAVNGSLWSLPIEFIMYIIVPIYYNLSKKNKNFSIIITVLVCVLSTVKAIWFSTFRFVIFAIDLGQMIDVVPYYFLGMMLYVLHENETFKLNYDIRYVPVLIFISLICPSNNIMVTYLLSYIVIPYVVMGIAMMPCNKLSLFLDKYEITYGIYLYGFFVQQCVIYIRCKYSLDISFTIMHLLAIFITCIVSWISAKYIEKPLIKYSKRLLK